MLTGYTNVNDDDAEVDVDISTLNAWKTNSDNVQLHNYCAGF